MPLVQTKRSSSAPRRFPLIARVIGWFLLNLALLAIVALFAAQHYFRAGFDSLLSGGAWDRVTVVAGLLTQELQGQARSEWDATLSRYSAAYGLEFRVFSDNGAQLAGANLKLPPEVHARMTKGARRPPRGQGQGRPGAFDELGPPGGFRGPQEGPPPGRMQGEPRPGDRRPPPPRLDPRPPMPAGFLRAGNPALWWVLVRVDLQPPVPDGPATIVMTSRTIGAGGLLVDMGPALRIAGVALLFSILFWIPLVRGITRSIARMRDATAAISVGKFDVRVDDRRSDELGQLGTAINSMAERIEGLLTGQKRFLSDVAHELCAPLSRLQVALGILEEKSRSAALSKPEDLQVRLQDLREEVDHMAGLVNELLSFSKATLGTKQSQISSVEICPVLERATRREETGGASITVSCDKSLHAKVDADLLARAVGNLVRNSVRYAGNADAIEVIATPYSEGVEISVLDRGPGVPVESLPKLFDPFYRVDTSRTRDTGGVGLGLTIARTCVEACGGTIQARNREGGGLEVHLWVPA